MTESNGSAEHARALAEQVMGMEMLSARGLRAKELARIVLDGGDEPVGESRCGNCGTVASEAAGFIYEHDAEGDWFCSVQCHDQHEELGCPHESHNGYRHPEEAARLIEAEAVLRSLASYVGCGGYNAPQVDPKVFEDKIRYGIDNFVRPATSAVVSPSSANHAESKEIGLAILARAKDAAANEAARQAWDAFYFKCSPDISLEAWTAIWKKGIAWWSGPVAQEPKS